MHDSLKHGKEALSALFRRPFWSDWRTMSGLWLLIGLVAGLTKLGRCNNFLIYKYTFWHAWERVSLYASYPEYGDTNHYGPLFSLLAAPFALVPEGLGLVLWCVGLAALLLWAVKNLPVEKHQQVFVIWFCAHELLTALFMQQFNVATVALILATYTAIERRKEGWAALFIVIGMLVKLYGVVGLAFFFFAKRKIRFILAGLGWTAVLFAAPMVISSPEYVISQYGEWVASLTEKGSLNLFSLYQNVSLLGFVRKVSGSASYSDLWLIVSGLILFALPYLRLGQYRHAAFRETLLASVLLFVVLFSTGSESSSYIIALIGTSLWYTAAPWQRSRWDVALMIFAFILTSLSPSDLFPRALRQNWVLPYALKAVPCILIWLKLVWEMATRDYAPTTEGETNLKKIEA